MAYATIIKMQIKKITTYNTNETWFFEASDKIKEKLLTVAGRSKGIIPYTTENGRFDDQTKKNIYWWTNGFWGGIMWQLFNATGNKLYKELAVENEQLLDPNFINPFGLDHDNGFKWLPTAVADYRLTGNEESLKRGLLAADLLAGRFNSEGNFIRAWNDNKDGSRAGTAIIDCMMNLPLLYWASETLNDPRYYHIATRHAETTIKNFIRDDFSVIHIGIFDPQNGAFIRSDGGQGMCTGSSWTRGQSWAVYGFTLSYIHTKESKYLELAERLADRFISRIPESYIMPVDFDQPSDCTFEDSTAAAIISCGLLELAKVCTENKKEHYIGAALRLLKTLYEKRTDFSQDTDNLLTRCSASYNEKSHNYSIIYGDYFFIEAVFKLTGEGLFIW